MHLDFEMKAFNRVYLPFSLLYKFENSISTHRTISISKIRPQIRTLRIVQLKICNVEDAKVDISVEFLGNIVSFLTTLDYFHDFALKLISVTVKGKPVCLSAKCSLPGKKVRTNEFRFRDIAKERRISAKRNSFHLIHRKRNFSRDDEILASDGLK